MVTTHSLAVHATYDNKVDVKEAREILRNAPGVEVLEDADNVIFPTPADVV